MEFLPYVIPVYTASTNIGCLKFTTEKKNGTFLFIYYLFTYLFIYLFMYLFTYVI